MTDAAQALNAQAVPGANPSDATAKSPLPSRRKRLLIGFAASVGVASGLWFIWSAFLAPRIESTENAYTNVEVAEVTPLVGGPVSHVDVVDTQTVVAGQPLFELDETDLRLSVEQADAALGHARRQVRELIANDADLAGQLDMRSAEITSAQANLAKARDQLAKADLDARRRRLVAGSGAISAQDLSDSETALRQARSGVVQAQARVAQAIAARTAAQGARRANQVLFEDTTVETSPDVLAAKARLDQARVDLSRAVIRAPVAGVVDQRRVAVGQQVQPGAPLMVVAPIQQMYVDANFKEGQLRGVVSGQAVTLTSDLYGPSVVYHGRVAGFAGGSGSAFAAIPAQNATGNWIKVVQRLPVRISLDPKELQQHPLRVGLSMHAAVHLSQGHLS